MIVVKFAMENHCKQRDVIYKFIENYKTSNIKEDKDKLDARRLPRRK